MLPHTLRLRELSQDTARNGPRDRLSTTVADRLADPERKQDWHEPTTSKGDRIELVLPRLGRRLRGTVYYADQLQVLVKWDDGRSESLRRGVVADRFRVLDPE
jgi:hypothetical protein